MPQRLEVLAFLQQTAATMRRLAFERPSEASPQMLRIADEISQQALLLEADLIEAGLIQKPPANEA